MLARVIAWEVLSDYRQAIGNSKPLVEAEYSVHYGCPDIFNPRVKGICDHGRRIIIVSPKSIDPELSLIHELVHSYQGYTPKSSEQLASYEAGGEGYWNDPDEVEAFAVQYLYAIRRESPALYRRVLRNPHWLKIAESIVDCIKYGLSQYRLSKALKREVKRIRQRNEQWLP